MHKYPRLYGMKHGLVIVVHIGELSVEREVFVVTTNDFSLMYKVWPRAMGNPAQCIVIDYWT